MITTLRMALLTSVAVILLTNADPSVPARTFAIAGPSVRFVQPATNGAEVASGTTMSVTVQITGAGAIQEPSLFWRKTGNYLACPGSGRTWRCTRSSSTYRWELDLGTDEGERRFFIRARDQNGETITDDRWVRVTRRPTGHTLSLVEPRLGTQLQPGQTFNIVASSAGTEPLRSVTVRSTTGQLAFNLVPEAPGRWKIGGALLPTASRDEVLILEGITADNRRVTAGPYRFRVQRDPAPGDGIMPIFRHTNAALSEQLADQIMEHFRLLLATDDDDNGYDMRCTTSPALGRAGDVQTFNIGDGNVNTGSELSEILSQGGSSIYFVNEANFCDGKFKTTYVGCSSADNPMVVESVGGVASSGVLWAHEFGHSAGLSHGSASGYADNLMSLGLRTTKRRVNVTQCEHFRAQVIQMAGQSNQETEEEPVQEPEPSESAVPIQEFIRLTFFDEFPFSRAAGYGQAAVPVLLRELETPSEGVNLTTVVATLGAIGDPSAFTHLIRFLEQGSGKLDGEVYRAKKTALFVLGEILARGENEAIRSYLERGIYPSFWAETLQWKLPYTAPEGTRNRQMSIVTIAALGVSGRGDMLAAHQKQLMELAPNNAAAREFEEVLEHALSTNALVRRLGIERYYEQDQ